MVRGVGDGSGGLRRAEATAVQARTAVVIVDTVYDVNGVCVTDHNIQMNNHHNNNQNNTQGNTQNNMNCSPNTGQMVSNTGQMVPNTGQMVSNTGQMVPNTGNNGPVHGNQYGDVSRSNHQDNNIYTSQSYII